MNIDVTKLLLGRLAVEEYQSHQAIANPEEQENLVQKLITELKNLGWDSIQDFFDYNTRAFYAEHVRCFKIDKWCDECVGRKRACYPSCRGLDRTIWTEEEVGLDDSRSFRCRMALIADIETLSLVQIRDIYGFRFFWRYFPNNVPPGCSMRLKKVDEPRFDMDWGMHGWIEPEKYEKDKLKWQGE